jgi:hypothetical protein
MGLLAEHAVIMVTSSALEHTPLPTEVTTDRAPAYQRVVDKPLPAVYHVMKQYTNNPFEADHGRLKSRLRPLRSLKQLRCTRVITAGHAFVQNICRGHYELGLDPRRRLPVAFTELAPAIWLGCHSSRTRPPLGNATVPLWMMRTEWARAVAATKE